LDGRLFVVKKEEMDAPPGYLASWLNVAGDIRESRMLFSFPLPSTLPDHLACAFCSLPLRP